MRRRFSTYLNRPSGGEKSNSPTSAKDDLKSKLDSMLIENEAGVEEICFDSSMAFDEVSSPVLAYKFSNKDFDPEKCK